MTTATESPSSMATAGGLDARPAGERYFRHPGDVVRLVVWGTAAALLAVLVSLATATAEGVSTDLARVTTRLPLPARELVVALTEVAVLLGAVAVVVALAVLGRWRRLGVVLLAAAAGAAALALVDLALDLPGRLPGAVPGSPWLTTASFPSPVVLAAAAAVATAGKPWLSRPWRRAVDLALATFALSLAIAGWAGLPELLLAVAFGVAAGAALLVAVGAPNRRPSPAAVAAGLRAAGLGVVSLSVERAEGGRAQLYAAEGADGRPVFVKVYARDTRDADLLFRAYRRLLFRLPSDQRPSASLAQEVEHEALLLLLTRRAGVATAGVEALACLPDGSMALALEHVGGRRLDSLEPGELDDRLLEAVWAEVATLHRSGIAHRSLRGANIVVTSGRPVVIDLAFAASWAPGRAQAVDRAELLASLAPLVGARRAVAAAAAVLDDGDLAAVLPFLQPLALSAATRAAVSRPLLAELRDEVRAVTAVELPPLERLVRIRPRTVLTVATAAGAFYLLLPQLADVDDSLAAIRGANGGWLGLCLVLSAATYACSVIGLSGGVPAPLPFVPAFGAQLASSFVNRVTPANAGGMALNVRFMQKAGIDPAQAIAGVGLNVIAGGIVHAVLLVVFFVLAGRGTSGFRLPASSTVLVVVAAVLVVAGVALATRPGRRLVLTHVIGFARRSWSSVALLARSPTKLATLFGGSLGVTLSYTCALAAAVAAFDGQVTFAEVGAVYLGSSLIAAAAPTPGGLGAMEAALVAGFTGVGLESGLAVAAVLSYRLATYWVPILPGWVSFRVLDRRGLI